MTITEKRAGVRLIYQNPSWVEAVIFCACGNEKFCGKLVHPIAGPKRNKELKTAIKKIGWLFGTNITCPECAATMAVQKPELCSPNNDTQGDTYDSIKFYGMRP